MGGFHGIRNFTSPLRHCGSQRYQGSDRLLGIRRGFLLLSVRTPLSAIRHGATVDGSLWTQRARRCFTDGAVLLRILPVQSRRWRRHGLVGTEKGTSDSRRGGRHWGPTIRFGQQRSSECREASARGRRSLRAGRGGLHRDEELPGVSCRHIDWRNTDVRHGRRIRWAICRGTADWSRHVLGDVLDRNGPRWPGDRRPSFLSIAERTEKGRAYRKFEDHD